MRSSGSAALLSDLASLVDAGPVQAHTFSRPVLDSVGN